MIENKMARALQLALTEGEKFAGRCIEILVQDWGADPQGIDRLALLEGAAGHLIDCCIRGVSPTPYKEYVSDRLARYSDAGLTGVGLTRAQYKRKFRE